MTKLEEQQSLRRYADYIRKAEEADEIAGSTRNDATRQSYRMIAERWHQLAEQVKRSMQRGF